MKDLLISKLREMVKVKKPKVKKTEPTEADREDFSAWQDKKERDREPSDIEDERNQMAKHYGQQSEAIAFSKKTILGQAARPMAAQMLKKRKAELQREPALANKGGAVAKELKAFSKDTYKQRGESTDLKSRIVGRLLEKRKVNPWAVCHASTGPEKSDKFERCVMDVKEKHGIKEGTLADRLINILSEAFEARARYVRGDKGRAEGTRKSLILKSTQLSKSPERLAKIKAAKAAKEAARSPEQKASSQHARTHSYNTNRPLRTQQGKTPGSRNYQRSVDAEDKRSERDQEDDYDPNTKRGAGSGGLSAGQRNTL